MTLNATEWAYVGLIVIIIIVYVRFLLHLYFENLRYEKEILRLRKKIIELKIKEKNARHN